MKLVTKINESGDPKCNNQHKLSHFSCMQRLRIY